MMSILKSTFSKYARSGRNFSTSIEKSPSLVKGFVQKTTVAVKATAYVTFSLACGYGGFRFAALILPTLVEGDIEREEKMKAGMEQTKANIREYENLTKLRRRRRETCD